MANSRSARHDGSSRTDRRTLSRLTVLRPLDLGFDFFVRMLLPIVGPFSTSTSRLRSFRAKLMHQIAMWSVSYPQRQERLGISQRD